MSDTTQQLEFIGSYFNDPKVEIKGNNLTGDVDFMTAYNISLIPHQELAIIFTVKTSLFTSDTNGNTVEAESELVMNIYKYGAKPTLTDLYGLYCSGTIANFYKITGTIKDKGIMKDNVFYVPTIIVHSIEYMKEHLLDVLNKAYEDS